MNDSKNLTKVLHIITSLHADGAQNMLLKIAQERNNQDFSYEVVSLLDEGVIGAELTKSGVKVHCLKLKSLKQIVTCLPKIKSIIKEFDPDIVQGWMYHANLFSLLAKKLFTKSNKVKLVWNIRRDLDGLKHDKFLTRQIIRLNALFSKIPDKIIYCGEKVSVDHHKIGFTTQNKVVIPNGFNCEKFYPSAEKSRKFRESLGLQQESILIGMIGRFHPQKNHRNFIKMAKLVLKSKPDVKFVLVGKGVSIENKEIMSWVEEEGVEDEIFLLGQRQDVAEILPAFDVFCLSSSAEGFPNVLGEAMACGVICVSTDAGASQEIIGDRNRIATIDNPDELAQKVVRVLELEPIEHKNIQEISRQKVLDNYQISNISNKYQDLYESISS